ncbi:potassium/proton antiporter, partial [Alistipes sp. OttesenSCG-928-L06]|nr:potassium/proton antiporter [Alistipes sp. OttesenSCG-928-L06]
MLLNAENILLIGSVLLFLSIIAGKTGFKLGVPVLLLFLGIGMLFGSDGLGIVDFHNPDGAQFIGVIALSIILFSGGMDTKYSEIRPIWRQGVTLATVGVFLTMILTGLFIHWISGIFSGIPTLSLTESMLMAAVMSSTDSASVFSILRSKKKGLKENLRPTLELESGSNDPMAYILTIVLIQMIQSGDFGFWRAALEFTIQMVVGAVAGFGLGHVARIGMNRLNINNQSFYPILLLAFNFFIFGMTDLLHGNGYLAVYIGGLVVGNSKIPHKKNVSSFFEAFTWLFQIVMFLALGMLVNPSELVPIAGIGLLIGIFMILFGRPLSVFISLLPFRKITFKAKSYISWVGLRGAVPIIFATYPMIAGVENASLIFNVVFFITIVSLLIQGTTVGWMAEMLGLSEKEPREKEFNMDLPDQIKSSMSEITVTESMLAVGNQLMHIPMPDNTLVVMVKRDSRYFVPKGQTKLKEGDKLLVISDNEEELRKVYEELGLGNDYYIESN